MKKNCTLLGKIIERKIIQWRVSLMSKNNILQHLEQKVSVVFFTKLNTKKAYKKCFEYFIHLEEQIFSSQKLKSVDRR